MICDWALAEADCQLQADVAVIGGGIAGLLCATWLAERGRRVVLLESGDREQQGETHPWNTVEQRGQIYAGAEQGRFRCLGGSSTRWGGAMLPFLPEDVGAHTAGWGPSWGLPLDALLGHLPEIEALFGLPEGAYEDDTLPGGEAAGYLARFAKWPPFRMRNVARLLGPRLRVETGPEVWLNACVTALPLDPNGQLAGIEARNRAGRRLQLRARHYLLAAGAIESTRLLLLLDRAASDRVFAADQVIGRHLNDHLSAPIAELRPRDPARFNRTIGFRFERGGMRNLRFELREPFRSRERLPASFTHIAFESAGPDGFDALRAVYRELQKGRAPQAASLLQLARHAPWLLRAAWWRYGRGRLLYPSSGRYHAHLVIEQQPRPENRISLSATRQDEFGLPLACIDWRVGAEDLRHFGALAARFQAMWPRSACGALAALEPLPTARWSAALAEGGGVFHPGGTLRIGAGPREGVVDAELRCHRLPQLRVISTAAFPTVGGANPTLMLMLYARYVVDRLDPAG